MIGNTNIRTVIAIDGTSSMGRVIAQVVQIVKDTFLKTDEILRSKDYSILVEMAVVIYRNYSSDSSAILQSTPFESDYAKLFEFLSKVKTSGGMGNEAVEVCFQALNKMEDLSQGFLIGDAPGNLDPEVKAKR